MKQALKDILKNTVITLLILEWSHQRSHNLTFTFHEKKTNVPSSGMISGFHVLLAQCLKERFL